MSETLKTIILAVVQGATEFLPVSSSGHLVFLADVFKVEEDSLLLSAVLHAGTVCAILVVYFKQIMKVLVERRRVLWLIFVASLPAGVVGVGLKKSGLDDLLFGHSIVAGFGLLVTAFILRLMPSDREIGEKEISEMSLYDAFLVGLAQCVAITPGISRSGTTICAALKVKLKRADAAEFSFLMAIPVIAGAAFIEVLPVLKEVSTKGFPGSSLSLLFLGFVVSGVVGYFALNTVIELVKKASLRRFSYYCFGLGFLIIILQIYKLFV